MTSRDLKLAPAPRAAATGVAGATARRVLRGAAWAAVAVSLVVLARALPLALAVERTVATVRGLGPAAPLAYGAIYVVASLLFVPGSALTLGAGALFGPWIGTAVVSVASTVTAALAFLLARHGARRRVAELAARSPRFAAVDRAIAEGGWRVVALLRLSPAMPFSLGNYLYGLTAVRFWPYVAASWAAMLPATFLYVQVGSLGATGLVGGPSGGGPLRWVVLAAGVVATFAATVLVTRRARRALRETALAETSSGRPASPAASESRSTRPLVALALVLIALASLAHARRASLRALFGPPPSSMTEAWAGSDGTATFDHSALDALLAECVREGRVDYAALAARTDRLDAYLRAVAGAPFPELSRDDKLAFLIDAYNAFTLRLVLDHRPLASIRDIPAADRWQARRWTLAGHLVSLEDLEHEWIRGHFAEPRVHFALVCAARGCPPLRSEAYVGSRLEEQLEDQARLVHSDPRWLRLDGDTLHLTRLHDWYRDDFVATDGSVLASVARHSPEVRRLVESGRRLRVDFLDYDWALNGPERQP